MFCGSVDFGLRNIIMICFNLSNLCCVTFSGFEIEFSAKAYFNGMVNMLSWTELNKLDNGFIVNDTCVVEVGIFVTKFVDANDEYHSVCNTDDNPTNDCWVSEY